MSMLWEVTEDDVRKVLKEHGILDNNIVEEAMDICVICNGRIEKVALRYESIDDQVTAALSTIEDMLIGENIITEPKKFFGMKEPFPEI
jgi:hypothetical protein